MQARARERFRASAKAKVWGKGQAKARTMDPGLKARVRLRRPVTVASSCALSMWPSKVRNCEWHEESVG